ncbi:biotin synthase BioB [Cerasicoccus arenae]|uniref:Biotin synthase n=1 Tax=Cerasicoccus arenae TaxID=424488 RepID=A0A8J3DAE3_9BACT|nr:biotin synthase BioB [Cerasicoccus arenae]MBK1859504.1 biotin synthase BioB [Cerasicoccus arenae]GHB95027.1 biotin synthase [Cerasicoccus arenae]
MTLDEIRNIYNLPLTTLIFRAQQVHQKYQDPAGVQLCTLKSIKTGRCPEDCAYCPQSAHNKTFVEPETLMDTPTILQDAHAAKAGGASRFCMGAAWRRIYNNTQFDNIIETVSGVKELGLEVCCTLGMLDSDQAKRLKEAGCDVYNHNLDTSREYYSKIITTRSYDDRLETLANVRKAGMEVCSGGILGMGESIDDRLLMLKELADMDPQPDSVPINALVAVAGTPLEGQKFVDSFEFVRTIATARIIMPKAMVRLSAGRTEMSDELQSLCYLAGANSIFLGDKLLTTANPNASDDHRLLDRLGLHPLSPDDARAIHAAADAEDPFEDHLPEGAGYWAHACGGDCDHDHDHSHAEAEVTKA